MFEVADLGSLHHCCEDMDIDEPVDAGTAAVAGDTSTEGGSTRHTRESTEILAERPPKRTKTDGSTSNPPKKGKRPYKRGQYGEGEGVCRQLHSRATSL